MSFTPMGRRRTSGHSRMNRDGSVAGNIRNSQMNQEIVKSLTDSEKKPSKKIKNLVGIFGAIAVVSAGVFIYNKNNENMKRFAEENAVSVALDHQGVIFNSVNIGPNNELITSIPASQSGSKSTSYNFYTEWLPGHSQVELYQRLTAAGGQTFNVYPITNATNEVIAVKAFSQLESQPK